MNKLESDDIYHRDRMGLEVNVRTPPLEKDGWDQCGPEFIIEEHELKRQSLLRWPTKRPAL